MNSVAFNYLSATLIEYILPNGLLYFLVFSFQYLDASHLKC